ncbi:hypothetical protein MMC10_003861 [Thelotrema lepadinum]|nr:hypothetical protein [Thelotrema lepadinum]
MAVYCPYKAPVPSLRSEPLKHLCKDDVLGYCKDKNCSKHHIITLVDDDDDDDYVSIDHDSPGDISPKDKAIKHISPNGNAPEDTNSSKSNSFRYNSLNTLTCAPRLPAPQDRPFDEDGPGALAADGPRHDNDRERIADIQILPTVDEIISLRPPYIPRKDVTVHAEAPSRLLECHFRQLRHDSIETILDSCYDGLQKAIWPANPIYDHRQETMRGTHYSFLQEVRFESFMFHEFMGAIFRLSFECPRKLRGLSILSSSLLDKGKMCALLAVHDDTQEVNVLLFESFLRESTEAMKSTGSTTRAAVQLSPANKDDISAVRQAAYYAKGYVRARFFLVDLPGVLGAGFVDTLRRLKQFSISGEFPFSDSIAPRFESTETASHPPKYSLEPGFQFDLNCLRDPTKTSPHEDLLLTPGSSEILQRIKELTTLDDGQAVALYENLSRRIAFTQGPPGTGKTFLGVAEAEVILKSQPHEYRKPIVVVCMTNHALDDFVASLLKRNINKLVRVGSRSACDWIERYLLHTVSRRVKANSDERRDRFEARTQADTLSKLGLEWAEELSNEPSIRCLQAYLAKNHREIADQFEYLDRVSVREISYRLLTRSPAGYAFKYWITGGDLESIAALITDPLETSGEVPRKIDVDAHASVLKVLENFRTKMASASESSQRIWNLDLEGRDGLLREWLANVEDSSLCEAFAEIHRRHQLARARLQRHNHELDARSVLEQKIDIVALTATGCARNWEFLRMLEPHTFLMEEASELTEASTIASLVPSTQHLIKIGDPYQLRPHLSLRPLCKEYEERYRLDESLFERLMNTLPFSRLNTQRRAHPDLADLLRSGDYPYLIDHPSTLERPEVPGLAFRSYWVHHDVNEDVPDPSSAMAKSYSNGYEVRFISNTVKYLIERHGYRYNTITILTPYNGQVALFVRSLKKFCRVTLTNEDKEALVNTGMLEAAELDSKSAVSVELGALLRVTTIDNYQGEENDVVFFSPVRSNREGQVGFLKTQNRINVAISRARNGFFVVGNSKLLENVPQWAPVVSTFKHKSALSKGLPVQRCSKHGNGEDEEYVSKVADPDDFQYLWPCTENCGQKLPCGHLCQEFCHPDEMHTDGRILCKENCNILLPYVIESSIAATNVRANATNVPEKRDVLLVHSLVGRTFPVDTIVLVNVTVTRPVQRVDSPARRRVPTENAKLDKKLGLENLYSFDTEGAINGVKIKCKPTSEQLQCPDCGSSTEGSPRYALARQVLDGQDIIGRLYAKIGRRLGHLSDEVAKEGDRLFLNINELCSRIKPGPLAVRQNHEIITKRLAKFSEARNDVARTRDELAKPVEEAIVIFSHHMNNTDLFPKPILSMVLRYERMHYRCRYLIARFYSTVVSQLKKAATRDDYIDLLISVLSGNVQNLSKDIAKLEAFAVECQDKNLKRLEVEFIIAKTSFVIAARDLGMDTPVMTDDLKRASVLCSGYPNSAGCLRENLQDAQKFIMSGIAAISLEDKYKVTSRYLWEHLGKSDEGGPKYCKYGHIFFEKAFPKGCPECGIESRN